VLFRNYLSIIKPDLRGKENHQEMIPLMFSPAQKFPLINFDAECKEANEQINRMAADFCPSG
jgi:hypothetical protein